MSTLLSLPAELIQQILASLEPVNLANVAKTCRVLRDHSYDDQIWQPLVNFNLPSPTENAEPFDSFRELYIAHHPHWFLTKHRVWFSDSEPSGKLIICRYDSSRGRIEGHAVVTSRGHHTLEFWERDREVIIHSFDPRIALDTHQPVLKLDVPGSASDEQSQGYPSEREYAPASQYSQEILMDTFSEAGLYSSFMLCRTLPEMAISGGTQVWPPQRFPAISRTRNETSDGFKSIGHRPTQLSEVSQHNFRLRKWVEYTGRRTSPTMVPFTSPNGLAAALGIAGPYFAAALSSTTGGGRSVRMPEDITTYATLPESCYTPTSEKPWQGIWCGDYSGHGCEFLVIQQPDKADEKPLPHGLGWLRSLSRGEGRRESESSLSSYASAPEQSPEGETDADRAGELASSALLSELPERPVTASSHGTTRSVEPWASDPDDVPSGRLEAIKLTGDPNIPRGEYTFIAPDIGRAGLLRVADEEQFRGSRVVRSAGHIRMRNPAGPGFAQGEFQPTMRLRWIR